jgi:predicted SAM-dependent methyltransferase
MKLDLACGTEKPEGYYGIDISEESNADEIYDLRKGIPISTNTIDEIRCHSFLEHLTNFIKMEK